MSDQVGREKEASDERLTRRDEVLLLGWAAAALAAVLGALSFFSRSLPADSRWCAVLASACLNVLAVTLWSPLSARRSAGGAEGPGWKRAFMFLWQIIRQDPDAEDLKLEGRAIRWQPWAVLICTGLSVAIAVKALKPFPPATLLHAMVSPSLVIVAVQRRWRLLFSHSSPNASMHTMRSTRLPRCRRRWPGCCASCCCVRLLRRYRRHGSSTCTRRSIWWCMQWRCSLRRSPSK